MRHPDASWRIRWVNIGVHSAEIEAACGRAGEVDERPGAGTSLTNGMRTSVLHECAYGAGT